MNIRSLQQGLKYRGRVSGVRQTYHVFEAHDYFFVLSFARSKTKAGSGYFNVVSKQSAEFVRRRFRGRTQVTAREVASRAKRTRHIPTSLYALNILYVLTALKQAEIVREGDRRQLIFAVRKAFETS